MARPHILVVEDESIVALALARRLTRWGYTVTQVTSGAAAVDAADTCPPGLVFMDVHLSGTMDSLQAAAAIWARRPVPIIYLTGEATAAVLDAVKTPPPVFTLSKPFREGGLQEVLSRALASCAGRPRP
jgi:CheY-like chemotaxis protein